MKIKHKLALVCAVFLISRHELLASEESIFAYLAEENAIESVSASQKAGGFTMLPFTVNGQEAGTRINKDVVAFREKLSGHRYDGLPQNMVGLLKSNRMGYLYSCLSASTSGREIEVIEHLGKAGFTDDGSRNTIALYGIYILYNGARDKQSLQKPIANLTESLTQAKKPLVPIGTFENIAKTLTWAVSQPIPPSPFAD